MHTYIHVHTHTAAMGRHKESANEMFVYIHTYMHTYIHVHTHTAAMGRHKESANEMFVYIHTCIHTYMFIHILQPWVDTKKVQTMIKKLMNKYPDWDVIALSLNIMTETLLGHLDIDCK